jgi:D-ribose pyranose/furanose isomerase RbsD
LGRSHGGSFGPRVALALLMADKKTVKDLLADEIKDLYSAEKQLTRALPKMMKGATNAALKDAFKTHLEETKGQVTTGNQTDWKKVRWYGGRNW